MVDLGKCWEKLKGDLIIRNKLNFKTARNSMVEMHETVVNTHVTLVIRHVTGKQKWRVKMTNSL